MDETNNPENTKSLSEVISEITKDVPASVWDSLPTDLSKNLDHYLYGKKKFTE